MANGQQLTEDQLEDIDGLLDEFGLLGGEEEKPAAVLGGVDLSPPLIAPAPSPDAVFQTVTTATEAVLDGMYKTKEARKFVDDVAGSIADIAASSDIEDKERLLAEFRGELEAISAEDPYRQLIRTLVREGEGRGLYERGSVLLEEPFFSSLVNRAADNTAKVYYNLGLHELFPRARNAGDERADKIDAQLRAAVAFQTVLQEAPLSDEQYQQSAQESLRTAVTARLKGLSLFEPEALRSLPAGQEILRAAPQALKEQERIRAVGRHLLSLNAEQAQELRAWIVSRPWREQQNRLAKERARRLQATSEEGAVITSTEMALAFEGALMRPVGETEAEKNAQRLAVLFGPESDTIMDGLYRRSDLTIRLQDLGFISNGTEIRGGIVTHSAESPTAFSPLDFIQDDSTAAWLSSSASLHGVQPKGFIPPTAAEIARVKQRLGLRGASGAAFDQLVLLEYLSDYQREQAARSLAPAPGEAQLTLAEAPLPKTQTALRAIARLGDMIEGAVTAKDNLIQASGEIPLVRQWAQGAIEAQTNNPALARAVDDPLEAFRLIPRLAYLMRADRSGKPVFVPLRQHFETLSGEEQLAFLKRFPLDFTELLDEKKRARWRAALADSDTSPEMFAGSLFMETNAGLLEAVLDGTNLAFDRPDDALLLLGAERLTAPTRAAAFDVASRAARAKRVASRLASLAHQTPAGVRDLAVRVRQAPGMSTERLGWIAASLDSIVERVTNGKRLGLARVLPAAQKILEIAPELHRQGNPLGAFALAAAELPTRTPVVSRFLDSLMRRFRVFDAGEDAIVQRFSNRLGAERLEELLRNVVDDRPFQERVAAGRVEMLALSRIPNRTAEQEGRLRAIRVGLNEAFEEKLRRQPELAPTDLETLAAEAEAGKYGPEMFETLRELRTRLGKRGDPQRVVDQATADVNEVMDIFGEKGDLIRGAMTDGSRKRVRRDLVYEIADRKLVNDVEELEELIRVANVETGTPDYMASRRRDVEAATSELAAKRGLLNRLRAERDETLAVLDHRAYRLTTKDGIRPELALAEVLENADDPVELVETIRAYPELFGGRMADEFLEGESVTSKGELFALFNQGGVEALEKDTQRLFKLAQEAQTTTGAAARLGGMTRFAAAGRPVQERGRALHNAAQQSALLTNADLAQLSYFATQYQRLSLSERERYVRIVSGASLDGPDMKFLDDRPWMARMLARFRQGLGIRAPEPHVLAGNFSSFWNELLLKAHRSGLIDEREFRQYTARTTRDNKISQLHTRPRTVGTEAVRQARAAAREQQARIRQGFQEEEFYLRRDNTRFRVNSVDERGAEVDEFFETLPEALDFVRGRWGDDVASGLATGDSVRQTKNAVGNDVLLAEPLGEEMARLLDLPEGEIPQSASLRHRSITTDQRAAAQFLRLEQLVLDTNLQSWLESVREAGGHLLSPEEHAAKLRAFPGDAEDLEATYHTLQGGRFGRFEGWRIDRRAYGVYLDTQRVHDRMRSWLEELEAVAAESEGVLSRVAKVSDFFRPADQVVRTSQITLSWRTWLNNTTFNVMASATSGAGVMRPANIARNSRTLREMADARARGELHPLMREMIEEGVVGHGLLERPAFQALREAQERAAGAGDAARLQERLEEIRRYRGLYTNQKVVDADEHAVRHMLEEAEHSFLRRSVREVAGIWFRGLGSKTGDALRAAYNANDDWFKTQAYLNFRRRMPREAAAQKIRLFFQDYSRIPGWVRQLGRSPFVGSLAPSFPFEAARIAANHLKYNPLKFTAYLSVIPAWNIAQMARAGVAPEALFEQTRATNGGDRFDAFLSFFTAPMLVNSETGHIDFMADVTQVAVPFRQLVESRGALRMALDAYSDPERRSPLVTGLSAGVGLASQFLLNTPLTNALIGFFAPYDGRRLLDPDNASALNIGEAIHRNLVMNYVPPWMPGVGRDAQRLEDILESPGVARDTNTPLINTVFGALTQAATGIRVKGEDPLGAVQGLQEQVETFLNSESGASRIARTLLGVPQEEKVTLPEARPAGSAAGIVKGLIITQADKTWWNETARHGLRADIRQLEARARVPRLSEDERQKILDRIDARIGEAREASGREFTKEERRRLLREAERRVRSGSIPDLFGDLDVERQVRVVVAAERMGKAVPEATVRNLITLIRQSSVTARPILQRDPMLVVRAMELLRQRVEERGGTFVLNDDLSLRVVTGFEPYADLYDWLRSQISVAEAESQKREAARILGEERSEAVKESLLEPDGVLR